MDRWVGRVALVTGASAGIGASLVEHLVKHGVKVVGCARNVDKIKELAGKLSGEKGELFPIKCDLRNEEEILSMFSDIKKSYGRLDICINNAGLSHEAPLISGETAKWKNMLDVNILALCICTREAIKLMKEKGINDGYVIHISSIGGHTVPVKSDSSFYCATKFAVKALTEGLRGELLDQKSGIRISSVSPGLVETEFAYRMRGEEKAKALYGRFKPLTGDDIADTVIHILSTPPHVQIHDIVMRPMKQEH